MIMTTGDPTLGLTASDRSAPDNWGAGPAGAQRSAQPVQPTRGGLVQVAQRGFDFEGERTHGGMKHNAARRASGYWCGASAGVIEKVNELITALRW